MDESKNETTAAAEWGSPAPREPGDSVRIWLPAILLILVAISQVLLAKTSVLSPWKGGGFGMFATTDGAAFRHVKVFVEAEGRSEELEIAPSQEFSAARAQLFPSEGMLAGLAEVVALRERRYGRPVETVRIEVWRTEFSPDSLAAIDRPLRILNWHVDQTADISRK
jgi:hypothetical protein